MRIRPINNKSKLVFLGLAGALFLASVSAAQLYQNASSTKNKVSIQLEDKKPENTINNEVNLTPLLPPPPTQNEDQTTVPNGFCKVTRNGVVEIVPADDVKVNEQSNGSLTVKVECENNFQSNNGSTKVENKVDVKVNTSN